MAYSTHVRRFLVSLALLSLFLGLVDSASTVAVASSTYQDANGAYQFYLPDGWRLLPPATPDPNADPRVSPIKHVVSFMSTGTGTVFAITTWPTNGLSLADAIQPTFSDYAQQSGYAAGPNGVTDSPLAGQPAKELTFHSGSRSTGVIAALYDGTVYLLTFVTTPDQEDAADVDVTMILNGWQFTA